MTYGRKPKDITGLVVGYLTVLEYTGVRWGLQGVWRCKCRCGAIVERLFCTLNAKVVRKKPLNCGCLSTTGKPHGIESRKRKHRSAADLLFVSYQKRAKHVGIPFDLSLAAFIQETSKNCTYCGTAPYAKYVVTNRPEGENSYTYNGLDRVDSSKGYNTDNVVSCCRTCNLMKNDHNTQEFLDHIKKIIDHQTRP